MTEKPTSLHCISGGMAGWVNASWPLAQLDVTSDRLVLRIAMIGTYEFAPEQVVEIKPFTWIPLLSWGVQIVHTLGDRPSRLIFWCFGRPSRLVEKIHGTGFVPSAARDPLSAARGIPMRWSAIIAAITLWNGLFFLDRAIGRRSPETPGRFVLLALLLAFVVSVFAPRSPTLQRVLLRPGRHIEEIAPALRLLRLVAGLLLIAMTLVVLLAKTPPH